MVDRRYIAPRSSSKSYVRQGGAKSQRYGADYWSEVRKRKQEQAEKLLQNQVISHIRFLGQDGQSPHYVFFGGAHAARLWTDEFRRRLDVAGYTFDPRKNLSMARPSRLRGISRRMVAVWSDDPMPVSDREYRAEVDALWYIEERNRILGFETESVSAEGAESREASNA